MPTPLTPERLAELKTMPHDPNSSYAVINRTDFEGLIAVAEERDRLIDVVAFALDNRCYPCGFTLAKDGQGFTPGNCSFRPGQHTPEYVRWHERQTWYMDLLTRSDR